MDSFDSQTQEDRDNIDMKLDRTVMESIDQNDDADDSEVGFLQAATQNSSNTTKRKAQHKYKQVSTKSSFIEVCNIVTLLICAGLLIMDIFIVIGSPSLFIFLIPMLAIAFGFYKTMTEERVLLRSIYRPNNPLLLIVVILRNIVIIMNLIPVIQLIGVPMYVFGFIPYVVIKGSITSSMLENNKPQSHHQ